MHELHLTNNNIFYTLIVSTNRYLDHFRILEEKVWGEIWVFNNGRLKENPHQRIKSSQHLIFHYVCDAFFRCLIDFLALISIRIKGRRALEDQGVSISKIKRRGQTRSRIKRSHLPLVLETLANFLFSISNISKLESFNSLTCLRTSNKEDQRNIWREGKGIKTFAIEGVYCWRWHCCRLNKKIPSEMGVAPCWQCLQLWSKLTCKETQPGKIGLRTETSVEVDFDKLFRGILIMAWLGHLGNKLLGLMGLQEWMDNVL